VVSASAGGFHELSDPFLDRWNISGHMSGYRLKECSMANAQRKAVANYRRRLKRKGMTRVEVQVKRDDAVLVRGLAEALADPERAGETRALLRERFASGRPKGLKALLASAPLEGVDLIREQDRGRDVDL
jgi:hypothetical protein